MDVDVTSWVSAEGGEPPHHGLGRSMKVGKEQIAGVVVALQQFALRDHDAEADEHARWLETLVPAAARIGEAAVRRDLHFYPRLVVSGLGKERAREAAARLAFATPSIVVPHGPLGRGELVIAPEAIIETDRHIVAEALSREQ
jgi:D-glucosaminate-6-phosphate ammonia-lyase